jgi:predicted alpha/beta-hydrolase family hydrolase
MTEIRRLAGVSVSVTRPAADAGRAPRPRAPAVVLGHGAGSDLREPLLAAVCAGLAARGYLACTFNFPYRERGSRLPDRAPVLEACAAEVAAAIRDAADLRPAWLVAGGKSMGGRIASQAVAHGRLVCRGLLLLGYPLHPRGQLDRLRVAHLAVVTVPMLFVSGTRDPLARRDLLEETVGALGARATLHLIPEGDHSLGVPRRAGRSRAEVLDETVEVAAAWLARLR